MALRVFIVPVQDSGSFAPELSGFLRSHKVLSADRRWVDAGNSSFWSFCVDDLDHAPAASPSKGGLQERKDYRDILSPADFAIFSQLRVLRKEIAASNAVPVYTIFTNEQLAEMVRKKAASKAELEKIAGVGSARIEKYGPLFLDALRVFYWKPRLRPSPPVFGGRRWPKAG